MHISGANDTEANAVAGTAAIPELPDPRNRQPTASEFPVAGLQSAQAVLYQGAANVMRPVEIARRLGEVHPLWLIIDFERLAVEMPAALALPDHLLDWLPEPAAAKSPVLVGRDAVDDIFAWIEQGWDKDMA